MTLETRQMVWKPTPSAVRKAAVAAENRLLATGPGSKSGACSHRGSPRNLGDLMTSTMIERKGATA